MTTFALVRRDAKTWGKLHHLIETKAGAIIHEPIVPEIVAALLAASEPPTDAEVDDLCRMMWPECGVFEPSAIQFGKDFPDSPVAKGAAFTRAACRTQMSAFLSALTGQRP